MRKHGLRIKLREQPFQILSLLLEHPGHVVTREELQKKLWPADRFVDFDHGLNRAVNQLRDALSDSADNPRFIETFPKRGYPHSPIHNRFLFARKPLALIWHLTDIEYVSQHPL